jgi:hypothetical protein
MPQVLPVRHRIHTDAATARCSCSKRNGEPASSLPRRGEPDAGLKSVGCGYGLSTRNYAPVLFG